MTNQIYRFDYIIMKRNVIALVSVFFPSEENVNNIKKISNQVSFTYICDNSPSKNECLSSLERCEYIFNDANLGLSRGFNKILKQKEFQENDYLVFFDQDSSIDNGFIQKLIDEYEKIELQGIKIGGIGPNFYNSFSSKDETLIDSKINANVKVDSIMTSSFLCKFSTLKEIAFWNENVFLDLSDWDLCWRLKAAGYSCYIASQILLQHTLGKGEKKFFFFKVKEGRPFRVYYQTRDCLRLITEKYVPLKYKVRFLLMLTVRPIVHFVFLGNRKERIKYFIKGIHDYHKGIYGSL